MNCSNCNNDLTTNAKFCGKCGTRASNETAEVFHVVKDKTVRGTRVVLGLFLALISFVVFFKIIVFIVSTGAALSLGVIDINISESAQALANVEATANILGFVVSLILANKIYKRVTRKNVDLNLLAKEK